MTPAVSVLDKPAQGGELRARTPAETLAQVWPLAPGMGITRIANITGLDCIGIPVAQATRPNACSNAVTQGKGLDVDAARVSALMEAVETWHAERTDLPLRYGSVAELGSRLRLVEVDKLPRVANGRFHPHLDMLWVEGTDLMTGESAWLPYETVHARFKEPYPPGSGCFPMSTNGLASGNNREEAVFQGLCEVVERDATTLFELSASGRRVRRIDLRSIDAGPCRPVIERFERAGLIVAAWDLTSDLGVPVFACQVVERADGPGLMSAPSEGFGCHPEKAVALMRSLLEAAQSRLAVISGARDDVPDHVYPDDAEGSSVDAWRRRLEREQGQRDFSSLASIPAADCASGIESMRTCLRAGGIEQAVAVELAARPLPYAVVRVVVPGLEPVRGPGYVPGRRARGIADPP